MFKKTPLSKRSQKIGLPPGTLVYVGEEKVREVKLKIMEYNKDNFNFREEKIIEHEVKPTIKDAVLWINIEGIKSVKTIEKIGQIYDIHPLLLEDILNTDQRPKVEDYNEYLTIFVRMLFWNQEENSLEKEQVCFILKENHLISLQEYEHDAFEMIRDRIQQSKGRIRSMKADYLLYALLDIVVDNYFFIIEQIANKIENIEDKIEEEPDEKISQSIHKLKRDIIEIRKAIWPLRDVVNKLLRYEQDFISENTRIYLRDVYDHLIQILENIEVFRDLVSGLRENYQSTLSNRMNQIINLLTIISTIFIPLSFLAGFYGMNFIYMPEFQNPYAYPILIIIMIGIAGLMLFFFRKKKWI